MHQQRAQQQLQQQQQQPAAAQLPQRPQVLSVRDVQQGGSKGKINPRKMQQIIATARAQQMTGQGQIPPSHAASNLKISSVSSLRPSTSKATERPVILGRRGGEASSSNDIKPPPAAAPRPPQRGG